ncbi:MAG: NADH-quinone oxidoreductase subunit G, partial [Betaproteobacteria bacterium]|nr:NADH-quinone oxidoreductase subunit G [Betaproteobacteria bacterium]
LPAYTPVEPMELERLTDTPAYLTDPIVRRAASLQETMDTVTSKVYLPLAVCKNLGVAANDFVAVHQGTSNLWLRVMPDETLPDNVARICAGHPSTAMLGPLFGPLQVRLT